MTTARKNLLRVLAASVSVSALCGTAFAQNDEIIVTAQKKEQNLQDVPISIVAFDKEGLEANRIEGLEDIAKFGPWRAYYPKPCRQ